MSLQHHGWKPRRLRVGFTYRAAGKPPMLTLYHCPETRSMRSLWLMHELQLEFKLVEMPFDLSYT
jgi:hypothetical protein